MWRRRRYVSDADILSHNNKCADVHCLWCGQVEGAPWTLAGARSHIAGAYGIGRQRGRMAGDAALPPQDTEEEVPLWGAGYFCIAAGGSAALFEHAYPTLIAAVGRIGFYFHWYGNRSGFLCIFAGRIIMGQ